MKHVSIIRYVTLVTFGATMSMTLSASANSPFYNYYPIAAPGCATSISPWRDGDTWVTGCGSSGDNMVYELVRSGSYPERFEPRNFYAKQVAVDPASLTGYVPQVWALTTAGSIYWYAGAQTWSKLPHQPSCTRSISVGWAKDVWIIKCDNTIAHFLSGVGTFQSYGGAPETLVQVAVPMNGGKPWFVAQSGSVYMYDNRWRRQPGCATSIGIGGDNIPWATGCGSNSYGNLWRWNGSDWDQVVWNQQINLKSIRVSWENIPWGIADGSTYPVGTIVERTAELSVADSVPQMESLWCWAAVGQSVYNYLTDNAYYYRQQCELVGGVLGRSDCCNDPTPCNVGNHETTMFNYLGIKYHSAPGAISWERMIVNLSGNSPFSVHHEPASGSGHETIGMGVYAWSGTQYVDRWDPEPVGQGTFEVVTYSDFLSYAPGYYPMETEEQIHF